MQVTGVKIYPSPPEQIKSVRRHHDRTTACRCETSGSSALPEGYILCMPNVRQNDRGLPGGRNGRSPDAKDHTTRGNCRIWEDYGDKNRKQRRTWLPIQLVHAPRCNGHPVIVLREPGRNIPLQAINGHCLDCSYSPCMDTGQREAARP